MEISFRDKKLHMLCESHRKLKPRYGDLQARRIIKRVNELISAKNLYDISKLSQARLHSLSGNRAGEFALDILHPYRIILVPIDGSSADLKTVTAVEIVSIIDYH